MFAQMARKPAPETKRLPHWNERGEARMVDVARKPATVRVAVASALVRMGAETAERLAAGNVPKGDVMAVARIAGIAAAKRTDELIPLCHRVALTSVEIDLYLDRERSGVEVTATARAFDRTGVEMEALVAASVASLTLYDMLKGIDRAITITDVGLVEKTGGRSGTWRRKRGP
jgi:cyclic pyranopterin phosphate synthase